jgi:hypothetical protein
MRKTIRIVFFATLMVLAIPIPVLAAGGSILSLTASGGSTPNSTITIQSTVRATNNIKNSNLYYTITGPGADSTIRATHRTSPGHMNPHETFSDSWATTNTGWPMGDYTLTLCWSTGNLSTCDIDYATTTFYSVPTLGWTLTLIALILLLGWLWHRRKEFEPIAERAEA